MVTPGTGEFWLERWREERIGFHLQKVNPLLERWESTFLGDAPQRVLVPLCGKSHDLPYLVRRGHDVVGVELADTAVQAFHEEHDIRPHIEESPPFRIYRSPSLHLYQGNFFDLTVERAGLFDRIYDRAALVALPAELRPRYVEQLLSLLTPSGVIFLVSLHYEPGELREEFSPPPFSVPADEVVALYQDHCQIESLGSVDGFEEQPRFRERGLTWLRQRMYLLRRR